MGIGTDAVKALSAQISGLSITEQRAAYAELVDAGNARLVAIDLGEVDARNAFASENAAAYEPVRAREVAKKLAEIDATKEEPSREEPKGQATGGGKR